MAKITKTKQTSPSQTSESWTPANLGDRIAAMTSEESLAICKQAGIITSDGKLAPKYKSWGKGPTMTPTYEQLTGEE